MTTFSLDVRQTVAGLRRATLAAFLAFVAVTAVVGSALADSRDLSPRPVQRVTVRVDSREAWPAGQWVPIQAGKLENLLRQSQPKLRRPRKTWIERATYWATFDGSENFRGGTLTADVRHNSASAELLTLVPLDLAVSELAWAEQEAIWGTTREGHIALLVDGKNRTLHGHWNLSGRKLPRSVEFDMRIPQAVVSQFRLRLPEGFLLNTSAGEITRLGTDGKAGWQEWQLDLGSQTRCRITIRRQQEREQEQARPFVLVESNCTYVIREDGLGLQAEFHVEAINTPVNLLIFALPAEVEVYSVTVGSLNSLSWRILPNGKNQLLPVRLPDSLRGRSRPIRITGFAPSKLGQTWELPQLKLQAALDTKRDLRDLNDDFFTGRRLKDLQNAAFLRGQVHLKIEAPVKLQSIETRSFRQTGMVSTPDVSETFSYQQFRPDALLRINVDYSKLQRAASILTHVETTGVNWLMTAHVDWRTRAGEAFEVRCQLPPAWEVTEVRPRDDSSALTNWDVRPQNGGGLLLTMEFRESIAPGRPKLVEVVARRLPFPRRQPLRLPLLQPADHDSVAQMVVVSHPAISVPVLDEKSTFRTIDVDAIPDFAADSDLWQTITSSTNASTLLLYSGDLSATAFLRMEQRGGASVAARIWVTHVLDSSRLNETFLVHIRPTTIAVDRVTVYLTVAGNDVEWHLQRTATGPLKSIRVSPTRHKDWELPAGGELWEIHLPHPQHQKFNIRGTRSQPLAAKMVPTLAIVPVTSSFSGGVELRTTDDPAVNVDVDVDGLATADVDGLRQHGILTPGGRRPSGRLWQYDSVGGTLLLRVRGKKGDARYRQLATLSLKSIIPNEHSGFSRHLAMFRLDQAADSREFHFELPPPAVLVSVALNGKSVAPRRLGQQWIIAPLHDDGQNTVEIEYRTPSMVTGIRSTRSIVLPQCAHAILDFDWQFATPPDTWLAGVSKFLVLHDQLRQLSWMERFFGPLGRPQGDLIFNPFSAGTWREFQQPVAKTNADSQQSQAEQFSPAGWTLHRTTAPRPPRTLTIDTWQHSRVRLLGWLGIIGCLLTGLLIRIRQLALRGRAFAYWLSGCLLAAWLSPPFYAIIGGGCLLGTIVALLFPRRLLEKLRFQEPEAQDIVPLGSTASFHRSPATALLVVILLSAASSLAQETSTANRDGENPPATDDTPGADVIRILVPETGDGSIDKDRSIVYIERRELDRLRESARRGNAPAYLVASAEYVSSVDEQNTVTIDARFQVHLLPTASTAHVIFSDVRVNPGECLVNDNPHLVQLSVDGRRFYVELARTNESRPLGQVESFDVKLKLRPATDKISGGNGYRLSVIPAGVAHLRQEFARLLPTVELIGARGRQATSDDGRRLTALLGKSGQFQVLWSKNREPVGRSPGLEAKITTHVEARPTWLEFKYHVDYHVLSGRIDFLVWQVPHSPDKIVIRKVTVDGQPVDFSATSSKNGRSRLLIELGTSQQSDFAVDVFVMVPIISDEDGGIRITTASIVDDQSQPYSVSVTQNLLGINAPPEFDLIPAATAPAGNGDGIRNLMIETFLARAGQVPSSRQPRFAYEVREPRELSFNLSPAAPQRKVRMIQTGIVRRNSIGWTLTADLETSRAPAFGHRLLIDPQLTITKISVREDDAERLVHWSRRGQSLQLFLSDKTTGIQSITLQGTRPFPLSRPARLPLIRIDGAEILDSRLRLYHEPQLAVELIDAAALSAIEAAPPAAADDQTLELLGQYRLSSEPGDPQVQVLRQGDHLRFETVTRLVKRAEGDWDVTFLFQFNNSQRPINVIRLHLPAEIADNFHVEGEAIDADEKPQLDGSVELTVRPQSAETQSLRLRVAATIAEPPVGEWTLPSVIAGDVIDAGHYLLIADAPQLQPVGHSADEVSYDGLPQWVQDVVAGSQISDDRWHAYFADGPRWALTTGSATRGAKSVQIPLVATRIWFDGAGNTFGRTTVMVMSAVEPFLELWQPAGMRVRALFVDGKAVIPRQTDLAPGTLRVPLPPVSGTHVVLLHWSGPSSSDSPPWWATQSQRLPEPRTVAVDRSIVSFFPQRGTFFATRQGVEQIESLDYELDVLESLQEMNRAHLESGQGPPPLWTTLLRMYEKIKVDLEAVDRKASGADEIHTARRKRFERISSGILDLRSLVAANTDGDGRDSIASPIVIEDEFDQTDLASNRGMFVGRVTHKNAESTPVVSFWIIDRSVVTGILLLIGLLVIPFVRRLVRLDIGQWLSNHQPVAWALLGLLWWTCLSSSAVGIVLLLVAVLVAVKDRQRQETDSGAVINVTLDPSSRSASALRTQ